MTVKALIQGFSKLGINGSQILNHSHPSNCLPTVCTLQNRLFSTSDTLLGTRKRRGNEPIPFPSSNGKWDESKSIYETHEYTTEPFILPRNGGRGPNGKIWNFKRSGGLKKVFRMIDFNRGGPEDGSPLIERVIDVVTDDVRSAHIALVAQGNKKRYVLASENMKAGDIIRSSREVTISSVRPQEGDSHPVGSLPIGTLVNSVERIPGLGSQVARSAGTAAQIVRKTGDQVILRMPSKREIVVSNKCIATVGRISNIEHNKKIWGTAGAKRRAGFKPRSGLWQRKGGNVGRKFHGVKPMVPEATTRRPVKSKLVQLYDV